MGSTCLNGASQAWSNFPIFFPTETASPAAGQMFEAPAGLDKFTDRLKDVMSWWIEAASSCLVLVHSNIFHCIHV